MLLPASRRRDNLGALVGSLTGDHAAYSVLIGVALGIALGLVTAYNPLLAGGILGLVFVFYVLGRLGLWIVLPFVVTTVISQDYAVGLKLATPIGRIPIIIPILLMLTGIALFRSRSEGVSRIRHVAVACLLYGMFALLSMLTGPTSWHGLEGTLEIVLGSFGVLLWTLLMTHSSQAVRHAIRLSVVVSTAMACLAVTEYVTGWNPYSGLFAREWLWQKYVGEGVVWRAVSSVGDPLVLGASLAIVTPVLLAGALLARRDKVLWYIALAANVGGILSTVSRSIYLALTVSLIGIIFALRSRFKASKVFALVALVFVSVAIMLAATRSTGTWSSWMARMTFAGENAVSYTNRAGAFGSILDFITRYPLGVGPHGVGDVLRHEPDLLILHGMSEPVFDNGFLDAIGEVSIFGLVSYVYLLLAPFLACKPGNHYRWLSLLVFLEFAVLNFSFQVAYYWTPWVTYFTVQALLIRLSSEVSSVETLDMTTP